MRELWDPTVYLSFQDHRLRPAIELLGRVPAADVTSIADLGCGTGNVTEALSARWPGASYVGVDSSPEMLDRARKAHPHHDWILGDVATWAPDSPVDLLYSNATLHWLDDHDVLFPRLLGHVRSGGAFAIQMPYNFDQPTHTGIADTVGSQDWSADLASMLRPAPVHTGQEYYDILAGLCSHLDIWSTTYHQTLSGPDPVVKWTSGSVLRPYVTALPETEQKAFLAHYGGLMSKQYPKRPDGTTVLPFTRMFIVGLR